MSDDEATSPANGAARHPFFTDAAKAQQTRLGSREMNAPRDSAWHTGIDANLAAWIAERDSVYLGTASADGQPYIQHRGGPKGFLKVIGPSTLAFADFTGNRQYLTLGNLTENPKAFLFAMDYANRQRVKFWGAARFIEDKGDLVETLAVPGYRGRIERAIVFEIEALDFNCPQHIVQRYDEATVREVTRQMGVRIAELEAENADLKQRLGIA